VAVKLFEMKRLSSGMAASLVGMDRVTFLLSLPRYGAAMTKKSWYRISKISEMKRLVS